MKKRPTLKLDEVVELKPYMRVAIADSVPVDEDGNALINVGYLRVSTDRQADLGYGLDIQESAVMNYCSSNRFPNLILFIDDGYTGTNFNRPALKGIISMIQDYNEGRSRVRINTMVIPRMDRLGRTLLGTLQFIQDYIVSERDCKFSTVNHNREDINFISVAENYVRIEKDNPQGKFLLMLFATLAEYDRDLIVEKLKSGRKARVAAGKWLGGGNTPYGYRYDKELGKLIVVPEEAEKVREVFRLYIDEKMPPQRIATRLGFKTDRNVTLILQRKSLTGCIIYNGEEFKGEHEPIISLERWHEAQDELEKRSVHRCESNYLLSGLVYCGECGAKMRYQKWAKDGSCKLICYSRQKSKPSLVKTDNCPNELFWAADIEDAVINELFRLTFVEDPNKQDTAPFVNPSEALVNQIANAKRKLNRLYDFEDEEEEDAVLEEKIQTLRRQIRELESQLENEEEKSKISRRLGKAASILKNLESSWPSMSEKERQAVCRELIDRVEVYKDGRLSVHLKLRNYIVKKTAQ